MVIKRCLTVAALFFVASIAPMPLWAAAGKVVIAAGDVLAINAQDQRRTLQRRSEVFEGDTLVTGENGRLQLRFEDNAILALRANSQLRISEYHGASGSQQERVLMDLLAGGFRTISGSFGKTDRDAYQVRTPTASIGIRGTHYEAVFESDTLSVGVYEGGISLTNDQGTLNLGLDSDFLFAQVEAGNLPRGLLNPPENLQAPNTTEADEDATEEEDGEEGREDDEDADNDDADLTDEDSGTGPDENLGDNPPPIPDADQISADDFDFSALEDELIDELARLEGDPRLTEEEEEAFATNSQPGFLVFATGSLQDELDASTSSNDDAEEGNVIFNYSANAEGSNPFYGASLVEGDDEFKPLNEFDPSEDVPIAIIQTDGLTRTDVVQHSLDNGEVVEWGLWNASASNPAQTYTDTDSGAQTGTIDQPFYYVLAEPTTANLEGRSFVEGTCSTTCFSANLPEGTLFSGDLTVGLMQDDLITASGYLNFLEPNNNNWDIFYAGVVFDGQLVGVLSGEQLNSTLSINGGNQYDLSGAVYGIFSGPENDLVFVGGLNASVDGSISQADLDNLTTDELYGVYILEENNLPN